MLKYLRKYKLIYILRLLLLILFLIFFISKILMIRHKPIVYQPPPSNICQESSNNNNYKRVQIPSIGQEKADDKNANSHRNVNFDDIFQGHHNLNYNTNNYHTEAQAVSDACYADDQSLDSGLVAVVAPLWQDSTQR